ncbi:protein of unknown function DUF1707 [Actinobacteria bacterium OK074]|nr:protein of unknown function DUF1707 [Actinobacteria bacterium OK074]
MRELGESKADESRAGESRAGESKAGESKAGGAAKADALEAVGPVEGLRASHADRDRVVDVLRVAAGDGRLTADELDERVEAALTARTLGELAILTTDLPVGAGAGVPSVLAEEVVRIEGQGSVLGRDGNWVVPRRLEIDSAWGGVTLDFTEAVLTGDTLHIDMNIRGGTLTLVTRPDMTVNLDAVAVVYGKTKIREAAATAAPGEPVALHVEVTGQISYGQVVVRRPRRVRRGWFRVGKRERG